MNCTVSDNILTSCADDSANAGLGNIYAVFASQVDAVTTDVSHRVTAVTLNGGAKFIKIEGRFEQKDIATEMSRENYNKSIERTLNAFVPNLREAKAALLNDYSTGKKLFVIVETYNQGVGGKLAKVFGYDSKLGIEDGGALLTVNEVIEGEIGGRIGADLTFVAKATELMRDFVGTIVVEDGSTGTTVTLG